MEQEQPVNWRDARVAVLCAVSFVLLVLVYRLWENTEIAAFWKLTAIAASGIFLFKVFTKRELVTFAGFGMLMVGLNYVWQEASLALVWKLVATVAVLSQLYTLGDKNRKEATTVQS